MRTTRDNRRYRPVVIGVLSLALAALLAPTAAHPESIQTPERASGSSILGIRAEPVDGQTPEQAVRALQQRLGAKIPLVSEYLDWDADFPTAYHQWLHDSGHQLVLLVKLKRRDDSRPLWSSLANAQPGSTLYQELRGWAVAIRDLGGPVYFVFHKEPNEYPNRENGSAAGYRDAWARVSEVFDNVGATNAILVFAMAGSIYGQASTANTWYPGDAYVDVIASSGVNGSCSATNCNWRSQQDIMEPMVRWAGDHPDQQLGVIEGATVEDPDQPKRKSRWIDRAHAYLSNELLDRMAFYTYWSARGTVDFRLTTSEASIKAATRWVTDPLWTS